MMFILKLLMKHTINCATGSKTFKRQKNTCTSEGIMFKNNGTVNDNGMSLVNQGGAKTKNKDHITCYACNKK